MTILPTAKAPTTGTGAVTPESGRPPGVPYRREMLARLAATAPASAPLRRPTNRRVLIPMLVGSSELFALREGLIAHALRLRGADVMFVLCDGFPVCDARTVDSDSPAACESCFARGTELLDEFGHQVVALSSLVDLPTASGLWIRAMECPEDRLVQAFHAGVDLGPLAFASTVRYFRVGRLDLDDPDHATKLREYLGASMVNAEAVRNAYLRLRPDKVFSSHGIYASWGPWQGVAAAMNVPYDSYGGAWRRNTLMCHHDEPRAFHCDDIWERWNRTALTPEQDRDLDAYLASREDNSGEFYRYFDRVDDDLDRLFDRLRVPRDRWSRIVGLFTNVAWDAAPFRSRGAFPDMFRWVVETIRRFAGHPDVLLLIKVHPAETRHMESTSASWTVRGAIDRELGDLPDNVRLISPDDNVSNYALYRAIEFGLVHTSSVGLEMALRGTPVLTTGAGTHYEKDGLVVAPRTRRDYDRTLDAWLSGRCDFRPDVSKARRYAYTLYFRKSIPFEPIDVEGWTPKTVRIRSLAELAPGRYPGLDALCDGILEDREYALDAR